MQEMKTEQFIEIFDLLDREFGKAAPSPAQVKFLWRDAFMVTVQWKDRTGATTTVKCVKQESDWRLHDLK